MKRVSIADGKQSLGDSGRLHPSGERGSFGEARIQDGFGGIKRYEMRTKWYRCDSGHEFQTSTNHYEEIYTCPKCAHHRASRSKCIELDLRIQLKHLEARET